MDLILQNLVANYIENTDVKPWLSHKTLMAMKARGKTRKQIKHDLFFARVRLAALLPNFKEPSVLSKAAIWAAEEDFLRRLAPFLLSELAHEGAAYVVEPAAAREAAARRLTTDDERRVNDVLLLRSTTYMDFTVGGVSLIDGWNLRAVFITPMTQSRAKWSLVTVNSEDPTATGTVTWYVESGDVHPCASILVHAGWNPHRENCNLLCRLATTLVYRCLALCLASAARS